MRAETEWVEIVNCGAALLCDMNKQRILDGYIHFDQAIAVSFAPFYGNGKAAEAIVAILGKTSGQPSWLILFPKKLT